MAGSPTIRVSVLSDTRGLQRGLDQANGRLSKFGSTLKKLAIGAALATGARAAVRFGKDVVKSASDAQQSIGASEQIFGKYADTVIKRSNKAAMAVGLSANEYRELSNVTGAMLKSSGMPLAKVTDLTDKLNTRAADLAATFGGSTKDAVSAVSSLLRGEADPIERYGVSIKQSDVNARLAAQGLDKLTGEARKQAEQQARLDLLFKQTTDSQGQFARESTTLGGVQQRLSAVIENLKAKIGAKLLPVLVTLGSWMLGTGMPAAKKLADTLKANLAPAWDLVKAGIDKVTPTLERVTEFLQANPTTVKAFAITLGVLAAALAVVAIATAAWNAVLALNPIGLVVIAIAALVAGLVYAYQHSEKFRQIIDTAWKQIRAVTAAVFPAIKQIITVVFKVLKTYFTTMFKVYKTLFTVAWKAIQTVTKTGWNLIKTFVVNPVKALVSFVRNPLGTIKSLFSSAWSAVKTKTSEAWGGIKTAVINKTKELVSYIKGTPGRITSALGNLSGLLTGIGWDIINGLLQGFRNAWSDAAGWLSSRAKEIKNLKGPPAKDKKILVENGKLIMRGFLKGLRNGWNSVSKYLGRVTQYVRAALDKRLDGAALKRRTKKVLKGLRDEYKAIKKNDRQQGRLNKKLKAASKLLADRVKIAKDYAASVKESVVGTGNITGLETGHLNTPGALIDQLRDKVEQAKKFAALIAQLTKDGLNKTTLDQLIQAGVEGGMSAAAALAQGGKAAVKQVNDLTKQLTSTGAGLGKSTADTLYGAGISAAEGLIKGLKKKENAVQKAATRLAKKLAKALKKALKIKSPSRVFRDFGKQTALGLTIGLEDVNVAAAGVRLADALKDGFRRPTLTATAATTGPGSGATVAVTLTAEQLTALERGRRVQMDLDTFHGHGGRRKATT